MIQSPILSSISGITHGFFTREGGISQGIYRSLNVGLGSNDNRENVIENRKRICLSLGVAPDKLACPYQVHSANVATVTEIWPDGMTPRVDALVTNQPSIALGVSTADCGPILFVDPKAQVVGAAHAGWRGALEGIIESTVLAMEHLGASRFSTVAVLGPTISQNAYEVGAEFVERFLSSSDSNKSFFKSSKKPEHSMFDLASYIKMRLTDANVATVSNLSICTYENEEQFFSYRRTTHRGESDYGRQISAIALMGNL